MPLFPIDRLFDAFERLDCFQVLRLDKLAHCKWCLSWQFIEVRGRHIGSLGRGEQEQNCEAEEELWTLDTCRYAFEEDARQKMQ